MAAIILPNAFVRPALALTLIVLFTACGQKSEPPGATPAQNIAPSAIVSRDARPALEQRHEPAPQTPQPPTRQGMRVIPKTTFFAGVEPGADGVAWSRDAGGPFFIDEFEVTVEQYRACAQTTACQEPSEKRGGCNYWRKARERHPMNCIDWYSADRFCRAQNKRLPTADEWQLAARGTDRRIYPWGNAEPDEQLCCRARPSAKRAGTCEVGTHLGGVSPFGVHDMAGNVGEWTASKAAVAAGTAYEIYGGGYPVEEMETPPWRAVRLDLPMSYAPTYTAADVGFRCVSDPS